MWKVQSIWRFQRVKNKFSGDIQQIDDIQGYILQRNNICVDSIDLTHVNVHQ